MPCCHYFKLMRATGIPNGLSGVGYEAEDEDALTEGAFLQQRLLKNAPLPIDRTDLRKLYRGAMAYW